MEKQVIKYWSDLFNQEIIMTVDDNLNKIDENKIAPAKQEIANKQLEKIKDFLPK